MIVELLNEDDLQAWDDYAGTHERSLFNSSYQFRNFLLRLLPKGSIPYYFVAKEYGQVVGILPSFICNGPFGPVMNSLPWFGSNPGVLADYDEVKINLLSAMMKAAEWTKCITATFISRPFEDVDLYDIFFDQYDHVVDKRVGTVTTLPDYAYRADFDKQLMAKIHQKTRNQIRKSLRFSNGREDKGCMKELAEMHRVNMFAMKAPVKKMEFDIISKAFKYGDNYRLYNATIGGESVAALLLKYFNKTVDYMTPAIKVEYRHLDPLHGLIYQAMTDAAKAGYKYWNWGGTTIPGMESVLHFKQRFGGESQNYTYYTRILRQIPKGTTKQELLKGYPYFYVIPFRQIED